MSPGSLGSLGLLPGMVKSCFGAFLCPFLFGDSGRLFAARLIRVCPSKGKRAGHEKHTSIRLHTTLRVPRCTAIFSL